MQFAELVLTSRTDGLRRGKADLIELRNEGARTERAVTGSTARVSKGFDGVGVSAVRMASGLAAAAASVVSVGAAIRGADQYQSLINGLRGMGQSSTEAAASLDAVAQIAQRTRAPLDATAKLYQRISIASGELGASQQEVLRFTENVGLALAASGTSANEASGALLQLSQAMAGGTVRAEEFNSILEGAFPIAQAAARGIDEAGGSVGRLRALVIEGKISSEEFFDAILSQTDAVQAAFANTVPTIAQATTVLASGLTMLVGQIDQATGATEGIASAIMAMGNAAFNAAAFISDNMDTIGATFNDVQGIIVAAGVALTASYIPAAYGAVTATAAWVASLVTLKGALLATGIGALIVGAGLVIGKFFDLVDATGSWGAALSALGSLAKGVWQGIQTSAGAIRPAINAVWLGVQSDFLSAMSVIVDEWSRLLSKMAGNAAAIPLIGETISKTLSEAAANAASSMSEYDAKAQAAASASAKLNEEAKGLVSEGWAQAAEAAVTLRMLMDSNRDGTDDTTEAVEAYNTALSQNAGVTGAAGNAAKAAAKDMKALADEIERLNEAADPMRKFNRELEHLNRLNATGELTEGAYAKAFADMNAELVESTPLLAGLNDGFGQFIDYALDGFKDGMAGIWDIFRRTLTNMIATAAKSRITFGLGMSATGAGAAAAGQSGPLGSVSSLFGGSGFLGLGGGTGSIFGGAGLLGMGGGSGFLGLGAGSGLATTLGGGAFGAAASFAIPALAVGALLVGLFKKTEVLVANGVRARIDGAMLELDSYEKTKENNGLGMSSGFDRDFTRLDDAVQSAVGARLSATVDALGAFGLGTDLTGFSFSKRTEIKDGETFEGESEEVIREALDAAIAYLSDGALEMFQRAGEGLSDTLDRLVISLNTVNPIVDMLGDNILPISLDGAAAASALADLAGGIEAFGNKAAFVYDSFLTDAEKLDIANGQLSAAFDTLNTALPETHAQFRDLMDAQDLSTEAGRQLYAALLDVAPLFIQVKGTAQEAADALQNVAGGLNNAAQAARQTFAPLGRVTALDEMASITGDALRDAENALRAAFAAEQDRVSAAYADQISAAEAMANAAREQAEAASQSAQERVQLRESIADALERAYRDRRVLDALGARNQISEGTAFLRAAVAAGGTSDLLGLQSALDAVANPATALFGSFAEYQQDFNVNTNLIEQLKDLNAGQLSIEQRALRAAESTVDAVSRGASAQVSAITSARDAQLSAMSAHMNALLGIDTGVMTLAQAIANFTGAQAAAQAAQDAASGGITSQFATGSRLYNAQNVAGSLEYEINQRYLAILGRNVDAAGLDFYAPLLASGAMQLSDVQIDLMRNKASDTGVPAFEGGGFTGYGSRSGGLDGRGGFMAMLHPNETVIDHTRQSGGGSGDVVAELRALRQSNAEMAAELRQIRRFAQSRTDIIEEQRAEELAGITP